MAYSWSHWEALFAQFVSSQTSEADPGHDLAHVRRVVQNARVLAAIEAAEMAVVLPAAWLHDCVAVSKTSHLRSKASRLAAAAAIEFLNSIHYPPSHIDAIKHAIEAHSFSADIAPNTPEARVVQDADRLDALGAVGIARCCMSGAMMGQSLHHPDEPIPGSRVADDTRYVLDHFYRKLLLIAERMTTAAGRAEADRRTAFMRRFLEQLEDEVYARWAKRLHHTMPARQQPGLQGDPTNS